MPRLFVAIDLPSVARNALAGACKGVQVAKWVKPEQLHLTLRFIGDADDKTAERIRTALAAIHAPPLELRVARVGTFPPPQRPPKILWAGVATEPALLELQRQVDLAVNQLGFKPESRKWSPHITLARMPFTGRKRTARDASPWPEVTAWLQSNAKLCTPPFEVRAFHLYQSELERAGPTHTILQTTTLF